ncbi:MAG: hypothetical protein QM572_17185 [Nocardioides sp.]|uniref:hypothetical protein n=1 Tax=Nocardioides sp. TaxID=35761 RepID=UPI0039E45567
MMRRISLLMPGHVSFPGRRLRARSHAPALLMLLALSVLGAAPARAVPDGGAGANTPGTNASVSPRTTTAGSTIHFTVSGYPAGEVVYIKIDDGNFCAAKGVHGACVVHQQRLSSKGTASGSFVLPGDLEPGAHWLRFLASKEMTDAFGNYLGTKGWTTRKGADFTIVAGGSSSGSSTTSTTDATTGATSTTGDTALAAGRTLVVPAPSPSGASPQSSGASDDASGASPQTTGGSGMDPSEKASIEAAVEAALAAPTQSEASPQSAGGEAPVGVPWVGSGGLLVMLLASAALVLRARQRRRA